MRPGFSYALGPLLALMLVSWGCASAPWAALRSSDGPVVRSIQWEGIQEVSRKELEAAILTSKANWRPWVEVYPFDPGTLEQDLERVRRLYRYKGFYEAEVDSEVEERGDDAVVVRFLVTEGPQITLSEFALSLESTGAMVAPIDPVELGRELPLAAGGPFSAERYAEAKRVLLMRLAELGHPAALISGGAEVRPADRAATVAWTVDPGPLVRLGPARTVGLERVEPDLVLGEIAWETGDLYHPALLRDTQRAIFDLGLFRSVSIQPIVPAPLEEEPSPGSGTRTPLEEEPSTDSAAREPLEEEPSPGSGAPKSLGEAPSTESAAPTALEGERAAELAASTPGATEPQPEQQWPLEIRVRERPPRSYRIAVGFGTEDLARAKLEWKHRNFFGGLRSLKLAAKYSFLERGIETVFVQPRFFDRNNELTLDALLLDETPPVFHTRGVSAGWRLERKLAENWRGRIGQRYEFKRVKSVEADSTPLGDQENDTFQLVYFQLGLRRSTVNPEIDPRSGTLLDLSVEPSIRGLGSDANYVKSILDARAFFPLPLRVVFASHMRIGTLEPFAGTQNSEVPVFKRFFSGGSASVRGFKLDKLGPRDRFNEPTGGLTLAEGSVELRFPIWRDLGGVAFVDAGQVALDSFDLRGDDFFYSAGAGLRYHTPIGPLRVDVGRLLNPPSGVDNYGVYFSLGQAF